MAKDIENIKKKGGLVKILLIVLVALLILMGVMIALLKFDVFGLGTKVIGPNIVGIPGASLILPEMPVEEEIVDGEENLSYQSLEEAGEILKVTENLLKEKEEEAEKLIEQINQLEKENERLKVFETNFVEFEEI
jgi:flagellar basal body-associated protein FliL